MLATEILDRADKLPSPSSLGVLSRRIITSNNTRCGVLTSSTTKNEKMNLSESGNFKLMRAKTRRNETRRKNEKEKEPSASRDEVMREVALK